MKKVFKTAKKLFPVNKGTSSSEWLQFSVTDTPVNSRFRERERSNEQGLTGAEWKQRGNEYFVDKNFDRAINCYTASLDKEYNSITLSNRAAAYLELKRWGFLW
jgi:hypothetical protein